MDKINQKRLEIWNQYNDFFSLYAHIIKRPVIPAHCRHNAHMYYILFKDLQARTRFIDYMKENDILTVFHYIPLHSSPAGKKYCKTAGNMDVTNTISDTLVRLPMFYTLNDEKLNQIFTTVKQYMERNK